MRRAGTVRRPIRWLSSSRGTTTSLPRNQAATGCLPISGSGHWSLRRISPSTNGPPPSSSTGALSTSWRPATGKSTARSTRSPPIPGPWPERSAGIRIPISSSMTTGGSTSTTDAMRGGRSREWNSIRPNTSPRSESRWISLERIPSTMDSSGQDPGMNGIAATSRARG